MFLLRKIGSSYSRRNTYQTEKNCQIVSISISGVDKSSVLYNYCRTQCVLRIVGGQQAEMFETAYGESLESEVENFSGSA